MAGPNGEMDWMHFPWSADVGAYINELMSKVDTIVLGRTLAEGTYEEVASKDEVMHAYLGGVAA